MLEGWWLTKLKTVRISSVLSALSRKERDTKFSEPRWALEKKSGPKSFMNSPKIQKSLKMEAILQFLWQRNVT